MIEENKVDGGNTYESYDYYALNNSKQVLPNFWLEEGIPDKKTGEVIKRNKHIWNVLSDDTSYNAVKEVSDLSLKFGYNKNHTYFNFADILILLKRYRS